MRAEGSSPPPPESLLNLGIPSSVHLNGASIPTTTTAAPSRKRKRAAVAASSPAPSDQASNAGGTPNTTDLLATSRADLSSRPILTLSRGPIFVPISEGSEWFKTEMVGVNRVGYRYVPAGINPPGYATPCRTIESNPTSFRISWEDRSPFLKVSKDGLSIGGSKGFRSARCNAPIREGKWYMEVKILNGGGEHSGEDSLREGGHVRLGWGRREASLNAPVGVDGYSYGYRDKTGEKVTLSRPRPYGRPFGTGDVIGMYISLPPRRQPNKKDPLDPAHLKRERIPIDLKGQEVFEILEYPQSKEMMALMDYSGKTPNSASVPSSSKKTANGKLPERGGPTVASVKPAATNLRPLPILSNSRIAFFVNGEPQGIAFQDIYDYLPLRQTDTQKANSRKRTREGVKEHRENPFDDGTLGYYPFISLFNDASVRLNPGPNFEFPPPPDIDALLDAQSSKSASESSGSDTHIQPLPLNPTSSSIEINPVVGTSDVKPAIHQNNFNSADTTTDNAVSLNDIEAQRTWQPACERYAQFMQEEWAFDAVEEEEAKVELEKLAAADKLEEDKRKQREKKRQQAEARRAADARRRAEEKARKAAEARATRAGGGEHEFPTTTLTPSSSASPYPAFAPERNQPSPSPLRHSTAFEPEGSVEYENSPAPTFASYDERRGAQSGHTSETPDNDMDVDHDIEALIADTPT
ncbi:COMPASS complex protein [Pholiota molesta]|nr:COMPASS complex protein [Pholiota molesta]